MLLVGVGLLVAAAVGMAGVKWVVLKMLPFDNKSEFQVVVDLPEGTPLERTNALLARLDGMAAKADTQVFGAQGLLPEAQAAVAQLSGLLQDTRASLRKVDAVLAEAQAVGANVRAASTDLGALRAEVEANLRKIDTLLNQVNRTWPFARDPKDLELTLP